jgi:hypothetical protein
VRKRRKIWWEMLYLSMDKVLRIVSLKDRNSDFIYWQSRTDLERLDAIEFLRAQYIKFRKDVQPGFQRVCRIVDQKQG